MANKEPSSTLKKVIIDHSEADDWKEAVKEWDIQSLHIDPDKRSQCICGHGNLKHCYTIRNKKNGSTIYPIGSSCIRLFGRTDLNRNLSINEKMFEFKDKIETGEGLSASDFSVKVLKYFYYKNVFKPNRYNDFSPINDCQFLLDMHNSKRALTPKQQKKVDTLINLYIKPFLEGF